MKKTEGRNEAVKLEGFRVWDKQLKCWFTREEQNKYVMRMYRKGKMSVLPFDLDGLYFSQDGTLAFIDDTGNSDFLDMKRFEVMELRKPTVEKGLQE